MRFAVKASPQATTSKGYFNLMGLPVEIREMIYCFALVRHRIYINKTPLNKLSRRKIKVNHRARVPGLATGLWTYTIDYEYSGQDQVTSVLAHSENCVSLRQFANSPRMDWNGPNVALLQANKEIARAGTQIFYSMNTFSVSPQVHDMEGNVSITKIDGAAAIAQAFLCDRSENALHLISHLEISGRALDLCWSMSNNHGDRDIVHWPRLVDFMRSRMRLRHLSLVAWGSMGNYENIFSRGGSRTQPGHDQFQALSERARNEVISQVPFVPRLSLTIVWNRTEECPRIRKRLQHDLTCFKPASPGSSRPRCLVAVNTAISTMWTQSLRKGLLFAADGPAPHNELSTRDICGRLFRDTDKNFQPAADSNPHGRHYTQLVMETDDHGPAGRSELDTTSPGTQVLPVECPYLGWKVLCDKPAREEDSELTVRFEEETTDAFEALGGSQNAATNAGMWHLG